METVLDGLKAAAERTRLRILALCALGELSVGELVQILGQSQPRISRHLKILCAAGLLDRDREGSSVLYGVAHGDGAPLARGLLALLPAGDPVLALDVERLKAVRRQRAEAAAAYFRRNAENWDRMRSLYVDEAEVERALLEHVPPGRYGELLDIGTGTGRIVELMAPRVQRSLGVDLSREMLTVARDRITRAGLPSCSVRQGDMYRLPLPGARFDLVTIHQVLHFADDPAEVIAEAARVLRPGGRLLVVDFAPHDLEFLRDEHAHRRLGFAEREVADWCAAAGLVPAPAARLSGASLTVLVWSADRPGPAPRPARPKAEPVSGVPAL